MIRNQKRTNEEIESSLREMNGRHLRLLNRIATKNLKEKISTKEAKKYVNKQLKEQFHLKYYPLYSGVISAIYSKLNGDIKDTLYSGANLGLVIEYNDVNTKYNLKNLDNFTRFAGVYNSEIFKSARFIRRKINNSNILKDSFNFNSTIAYGSINVNSSIAIGSTNINTHIAENSRNKDSKIACNSTNKKSYIAIGSTNVKSNISCNSKNSNSNILNNSINMKSYIANNSKNKKSKILCNSDNTDSILGIDLRLIKNSHLCLEAKISNCDFGLNTKKDKTSSIAQSVKYM